MRCRGGDSPAGCLHFDTPLVGLVTQNKNEAFTTYITIS